MYNTSSQLLVYTPHTPQWTEACAGASCRLVSIIYFHFLEFECMQVDCKPSSIANIAINRSLTRHKYYWVINIDLLLLPDSHIVARVVSQCSVLICGWVKACYCELGLHELLFQEGAYMHADAYIFFNFFTYCVLFMRWSITLIHGIKFPYIFVA